MVSDNLNMYHAHGSLILNNKMIINIDSPQGMDIQKTSLACLQLSFD